MPSLGNPYNWLFLSLTFDPQAGSAMMIDAVQVVREALVAAPEVAPTPRSCDMNHTEINNNGGKAILNSLRHVSPVCLSDCLTV